MLRTIRSPIPAASAASAGIAFLTSADDATSAWRVIAPIVTALPLALIPFSSGISPRSITCPGFASRSFIDAMSVWPPASSFASGFLPSAAAASATDFTF